MRLKSKVKKRGHFTFTCIMVALITLSGILPYVTVSVKAEETEFNFNTTDTYLSVTSYNGKPGIWLLQIDGNNPSAGVKFEKQISSNVTGLDSLAMSRDGSELYGIVAEDNTLFYKITEDGNATIETLNMPSELSTFKPQGAGATDPITGNYGLFVRDVAQGLSRIVLIDPQTGNVTDSSISPNNRTNLRDLIFDDEGNIYYIDATNEEWVRYDRTTGQETVYGRVGNIPLTTPGYGAGLSYLPSNELLIVFTRGDLFASKPEDNIARHLTQIPDINFLTDAASAVFPNFYTNLDVQKFANGSKDISSVKRNDIIEYEIVVSNTGNLPADNVVLTDAIPEGTEYIANSTKLNGSTISDINGQSPLESGLKIKSSPENVSEGVIITGEDNAARITFQVKVKDEVLAGSEILNQATVSSNESGEIQSNEVISTIEGPVDPPAACAAPVALINGDFDKPEGPGTYDNSVAGGGYYYADTVPGWKTTDFNRTPRGIIQIMDPARPSTIPSNAPNQDNLTSRFAELNADTNSMLYQEIPTVPGQTIYWRLDHRGYNGVDTMSVNIGPVTADPFNTTPEIERISTGTTWETYSGSYTVPAGQTITRFGFKAISTSTGALAFGNYLDNIFLGTEPCVVAEKTVSPGGEVYAGQVLTYEVNIKNTGGDIAANTIFEDAIPAGTEYVPGSLKIIDGPGAGDLTDQDGDDAGQYDEVNSKVIIQLGDLPNTTNLPDGITVQFKVTALDTNSERVVSNKALINYDNLLTNESKTTETNETTTTVLPREEIDACAAPVALVNGSFEEPTARMPGDTGSPGSEQYWMYFYEDEVPGWKTTASDKRIQIMKSDFIYQGYKINPPDGDQYAELNAHEVSSLYQDVDTTPGQTIYWRLAHKGLLGVDTMSVQIGSSNTPIQDLPVIQEISDDNTNWGFYSGTYEVPAGQTSTRFAFTSVSAAGGSQAFGNLLDDIFLGTEPCVVAEKTVSPSGEVFAGDELTYEVTVKNNGGDLASNTVFEDAIPAGTEYVPGSLKIIDGPGTGALTDDVDNDAGHFDGEKVIVELGDLPNTNDLPNGVTVQFKVRALLDETISEITNKAQINYDNLLTNESKTTESNETTTGLTYKKPVLDSKKSSDLFEKADGNTDTEHPEVGDILTYTIETRNTIENSLIKNLTISDSIPEGLEYVPGTLEVDGQAVTDADGDDEGQVVNGNILAQFGDVSDTAWHKVTFQVVIGAGQASKDIENIATVDGDNIDVPDEPTEEVLVYPRVPELESEKVSSIAEKGEGNTLADTYQVGDTILYTIRAHNIVRESVVENFVIADVLPVGLTFVEGSLQVSHGGTGTFENGTVTANFGTVTDNDYRTVTFQATIDSGQSNTTIKNTATVDGDNVVVPNEPENEITVEPRDPKLESDKKSEIDTKAVGNSDTQHPEVGDILTYTIQTRNTIEDSLVTNLTIRDVLPEGLEYVAGTLSVDGVAVTDEAGDDAGQSVGGEILGEFGNITDTEWHTVTFQVVIGEGQASKDIENKATVDGDNIDVPDEPTEEVLVYPRIPDLESEKVSSIAEKGEGNTLADTYQVGDTVLYTIRAHNTVRESVVENFVINDILPEGLSFVEGSMKVSHGGIANFSNGTITANFGDVSDTEWRTVTFQATIDSGQVGNTLRNVATVDGDNVDEPDEADNEFTVNPRDPELLSRKSSTLTEKAEGNLDTEHAEVGDILTYTIDTRNIREDSLISNLVISDTIPAGLEYVPGTLTVDGLSTTDAIGDDAGYSINGEIKAEFGNVTDTEWHTVTFQVRVLEGQAGEDIVNIASVDGDNVTVPDKPENEVNIYPRNPVLESEKTASNADEGKENYEAGDTVIYTIKARNTVEDSFIEDLVITDILPEGLTFVLGSIEVSHEGTVHYENGTITANFGDVTDTEWRTVTFQATINSDQFGSTIENVATVDGSNIETPDRPKEEIIVDKEVPVTPEEPDNQDNEPNLSDNNDKDKDEPDAGSKLPVTSTNNYNFLVIGTILLLAGITILFVRRRLAQK